MDIAFIGAGSMAGTLMERVDVIENAEIIAVCDINKNTAAAKADPRNATIYTDHEELYESEPLDAVFIAIPPFAYEDQVSQAAGQGIDVFIEKPVSLRPSEGREVLTAIDATDIVTAAGYVFRYDGITEMARELLEGREIATLAGRYWSGLLANSWGNELDLSGGEIVTRTTHLYDLVRYFGGDVEEVGAAETKRIDVTEVDYADATTATLRHNNGIVSSVTSAITSSKWTAELDIVAEDAFLRLDYVDQTITGSVDGEAVDETIPTDRYGAETEAFIDASRHDNPSYIRSDYRDALQTLSLTWTVIDAAETGEFECVGETPRS